MSLLLEETPQYKIEKGTNYLADIELISLIISGNVEKANAKARSILGVTTLNQIGKLSMADLIRLGLTKQESARVIAAIELGRRRDMTDLQSRVKISCSRDAYNVIGAALKDLPIEEFWIIYVNKACEVIGKERLSIGGTAGTVADVKVIFRMLLENKANAFIAVHNHPSGNLTPSSADVDLTKKLKEIGKTMDLPLLDHLIISEKGYYSFADEGVI